MISIFFEKYKKEFENYYSIVVPKYISIIKASDNEVFTYDKLFILFIRNNEISPYLRILSEELIIKLHEESNPEYIYKLFCIIEKITLNQNYIELYFNFIIIIIY